MVLGPFSPVSAVIRPTFYRQFVGGDTEKELTSTAEKLKSAGLRLMVCPAQEEDQGEAEIGNESVSHFAPIKYSWVTQHHI